MKKRLIITLVLVFILGISCSAFAGPFADVPAKHWSYDAIDKLTKAGIVEGYGDGTFRGDKTITRYEMAQIVAKAIEHTDKADPASKALINKLSAEYSQELRSLGVRVAVLEDKADNVKFSGETRFRYDNITGQNLENSQSYLDLWANAKINKDWTAKAEFEASHNRDGSQSITNNTSKIFAVGSAFGGTMTIGKFNPFAAYGLVFDDSISGGQFQFGDTLKTRLAYGKLNASKLGNFGQVNDPLAAGFVPQNVQDSSYAAVEMDYALSKNSNVKVAYHRVGLSPTTAAQLSGLEETVNYWECGFDTKIAKNWSVFATGSKSDLNIQNQDNKGYMAQLQYKASDVKKVGSYDVFYNYRKVPLLSEINSTWDYSRGIKGNQVGFEYVPMLNSKITVSYLAGHLVDDNSKVNVLRTQLQLFF